MNIVTQYLRRIGKYFDSKDDLPTVSQPGTNHIDDGDIWTDKTIYKGEIVTNLRTGKQYTSDGDEILELNYENAIVWGMQVVSIPGASVDADPLYIRVTNGYIRIHGKQYKHIGVTPEDSAPGDLVVSANTSISARYDLIYASSDFPHKVNDSDKYYKAKLIAIKGFTNFTDIYNNDAISTKLLEYNLEFDDVVLLGIVYVPPLYYATGGLNRLRPWSWGVSSDGTNENQLNFIEGQQMFAPSIMPSTLIDNILGKISIHRENNNLRYRYVYLKNQILSYDNELSYTADKKLYKVIKTHFCESLDDSIINDKIAVIAGIGIGSPGFSGSTNHSELNELSFNASGHIGFQRQTYTLPRDPDYDDSIDPPPGSVIANPGTFWVNTDTEYVFICLDATPGAAIWKNAISDIRSTEADKNIVCSRTENDGDPAISVGITNTPTNDTYVKVEVNGIGVVLGNGTTVNCDIYFSSDSGITAKAIDEIVIGDILYWMGSYAGYELETNDEISIHYLIASTSIGLGDIDGPIWGGDTLTP